MRYCSNDVINGSCRLIIVNLSQSLHWYAGFQNFRFACFWSMIMLLSIKFYNLMLAPSTNCSCFCSTFCFLLRFVFAYPIIHTIMIFVFDIQESINVYFALVFDRFNHFSIIACTNVTVSIWSHE